MSYKVIVVGSGFAGLSAVVRLKMLGISNVFVIEARDNVGGRVKMINYGGSTFNIGPEWLHGQKNNAIYQLAKNKLKLQVKDSNNYKFYFSEPKHLLNSQREKLFKSLLENLRISTDHIFATVSNEQLENKTISDVLYSRKFEETTKLDKFVGYWAFNYEIGSSPDSYSALLYKLSSDIYKNIPSFSDYYFVEKDGFVQTIDYFRKQAEINENNIKFNDPVEEIRCKSDKVEVITKSNNYYEANFCICAIPMSVIRSQLIKIRPDLDNDVYKTMSKLKFSTYTRIFIELKKPQWIKSYDWLINISENIENNISLWQNPRDNSQVLIAHLCNYVETSPTELNSKIETSLINILGDDFNGFHNVKAITLEQCPYSLGAFPCASSNFNLSDVTSLRKLNNLHRLTFAGDSYKLDYFGTVQGAVQSGSDAADTIYEKFIQENSLSSRTSINAF